MLTYRGWLQHENGLNSDSKDLLEEFHAAKWRIFGDFQNLHQFLVLPMISDHVTQIHQNFPVEQVAMEHGFCICRDCFS